MDAAIWVAVGAVVVSLSTLIWQIIDKRADRKETAQQQQRALAVEQDEKQLRKLEATAEREREMRQEFAIGFVAWVGVMRDAIREPYMRGALPESPERTMRLWGHAPKELFVHRDRSQGAGQLIKAGEAFFRRWDGDGLAHGGNFAMIRDAERLVAMVGRWVDSGRLPEDFDHDDD